MLGFLAGICLGVVLNLMGYSVVDAAGTLNLNNLIIYLLCLGVHFLGQASIYYGFIKRLEKLAADSKDQKDIQGDYWELET